MSRTARAADRLIELYPIPSPTTFNPAYLWRRYPRECAGLAMLAAIAAAVVAGSGGSTLGPSESPSASRVAPPVPPAMEFRPIAPEDAVRINNRIPIVANPIAARPFVSRAASAEARQRALDCLASAIYYEAGRESVDGQRAVAQVILNRVRHPAFPNSVCGVVYQGSTRPTGCQFTFTCDGSMARAPARRAFERARRLAAAALAGSVYPAIGSATHYHAYYVVPYWASSLAKTAVVGAHLFYRWSGDWGRPSAFAQRYSGREADPQALRAAAMHTAASPATLLPADAAVAVPGVTPLDGVLVLAEADAKRLQMLFKPKAQTLFPKAGQDHGLERTPTSDNQAWTLSGDKPPEAEKRVAATAERAAALTKTD